MGPGFSFALPQLCGRFQPLQALHSGLAASEAAAAGGLPPACRATPFALAVDGRGGGFFAGVVPFGAVAAASAAASAAAAATASAAAAASATICCAACILACCACSTFSAF